MAINNITTLLSQWALSK